MSAMLCPNFRPLRSLPHNRGGGRVRGRGLDRRNSVYQGGGGRRVEGRGHTIGRGRRVGGTGLDRR